MQCAECERLSRAEIDATRRASDAQSALESFIPAPPYGESAVREFARIQQLSEQCREQVQAARALREAHGQTHAMTISS